MLRALRRFPQFTNITAHDDFGADPIQLLADDPGASLQRGFALVAAYTLSKTADNYLKQDASGEGTGRRRGRDFPHLLKLTWIYELPIGPGNAVPEWRARSDRRRLDDHGIRQLPHAAGHPASPTAASTTPQHRIPLPSRHRRGCRPIIFDGSHLDLVRGTRSSSPRHFDRSALSAQAFRPARRGAGGPRHPRSDVLVRGHRPDEALHGGRRPSSNSESI